MSTKKANNVEVLMKRKVKYKTKYLNNIVKVMAEHINSNLKDYLILSIIFVIGVMFGVIIINNSNEQSKIEMSGYINSFIEAIRNKQFEIDRWKLMQISIWENIKITLAIWFAGSTIIGIPLIYVITLYKGFCLGYTISAIIVSLGAGKRNMVFYIITIFTKYYCDSNSSNALC